MGLCRGARRNRPDISTYPLWFNIILIGLGIFIILALSVIWIIMEEFTAFTDYTQQWIEFNFFLYYWDKLTITRTYLSFIHIYGALLIAIASFQIHGLRKRDINILYLAPYLLASLAIITMLGAIAWLIVTAVNHNEGFLATGGFIFERMRFKGNVWKDLKYREQSFRIVADNTVPRKAVILKTWINQRQRDFSCCGWNSYMDYADGNYSVLPESCCKRQYRTFGCGANYLTEDKSNILNTRGCGNVMYSWYRSGFTMNVIMAIFGILIASFQFFTYTTNRQEYFNLIYELDDMAKPMMNTMSMSTINSKSSAVYGAGYSNAGGNNSFRGGVNGSIGNGAGGVNGSFRGANNPNGSMRSNALLQPQTPTHQLPRLITPNSVNLYAYNNNNNNKPQIYDQTKNKV